MSDSKWEILANLGKIGAFTAASAAFGFSVGGWYTQGEKNWVLIAAGASLLGGLTVFLLGMWIGRATKKPPPTPPSPPNGHDTDEIDGPQTTVNLWLRSMSAEERIINAHPNRPDVLLVANMKGGVAKTMLSANIGAALARGGHFLNGQQRILLCDLDYQGSLSDMILTAFGVDELPPENRADHLISGVIQSDISIGRVYGGKDNYAAIALAPTDYGFDDFETRAMFEWYLGRNETIRTNLLVKLNSINFRNAFGLTIVDTGPRLSLGTVAGIAASKRILIPTACDDRSIRAVVQFLERLRVLRDGLQNDDPAGLFPHITVAGVVLTLTGGTQAERDLAAAARAEIGNEINDQGLRDLFVSPDQPIFESELKRSQPIVTAAQTGIPYLTNPATRSVFDPIIAELLTRM